MPLIPRLVEKLQRHPKRIVFPEGEDPRILQAARQWVTRRMGVPVLLGSRLAIKETAQKLDLNTQGMRLIDPAESEDIEDFANRLVAVRQGKGMEIEEARKAVQDPNYYATMMLATSQVDALVSGATVSASSALRPLFQIIPRREGVQTAASLMIIAFDEKKVGSQGTLFFADCGVIPEPTVEQMADIAVTTAMVAHHLTGEVPRVAMLSYASKSQSTHPALIKVRAATEYARQRAKAQSLPIEVDGELQADAALDATIAQNKRIASTVAGRANVLIFPDLAAANIGFKLVQVLAGAATYGQIITGLRSPAAEISRGASAHDVFGTATLVGVQAIDSRLLHGAP